MRIAIDARPLLHPTTGIGRYTSEQLERMKRSSHELLLLGCARAGPASSLTGRLADTLTAFARFGPRSRSYGADVYWSPRHHLPAGLGRTPAVVTIHDLIWKNAPATMERGRRTADGLLMGHAVRTAATIIVVSESTRRDLIEAFPEADEKTITIPLGAARRTARAARPSHPYMLFIGAMEPRKNLARLLDAFEKLIRDPTITHNLVVAGSFGWKSQDVLKRLESPMLAPRVEQRGQVDEEVLAELYAGADFLVAPSLYEGFGLQVLEAMSYSKPVITSNISSLPEVVGDAGLLVDPYSPNQICDAMRQLIRDRELHQQLSARASRRAAAFSWDRCAADTLHTIEAAALAR